ncbi:hypothetical protein [Streptomyces sp. Qhu_M48]|uniref:hypothetical protein n=1 Tax=Streptomyces sp. Qhu_M48 TaxID=3435889 RepID=UPI003F5035C8
MRDREAPSRTASGLSTEDIAQRGGRGTDPEGERERERGTENAPVYPGESTAVGDTTDSGGEFGRGEAPEERTREETDAGGRALRETDTGSRARQGTDAGDSAREEAEAAGPAREGAGAPRAARQEGDSAEPARQGAGAAEPAREESTAEDRGDDSARLLDSQDDASFRDRWSDVQSMFVDDPREAVLAADALVADVMRQLAATFADHKRNLEGQWGEGDAVDTESLRVALRQYRSFFNRLLSR